MRLLRIALVGFGHVGRRFALHLGRDYERVLRSAGVRPRLTGVATARHGCAIRARGLDAAACLALARSSRPLDSLHRGRPVGSTADFVGRVPADVLIELTPLDPRRGEPAISHARLALGRDLHVVTANKGPVAFALRSLQSLARRRGRLFLHEGVVMDGTPLFNMVRRCLPGAKVLGFRGTLNSTTSHILSRMEEGRSAAEALREAQAAGIAEADPSLDLEGWDAAAKGCALANALMGASVRPQQVRRRGIGGVTAADVRAAAAEGSRMRLVVRGARRGRSVRVAVAPERVPLGDPLSGPGADAALVLETDLMGEIAVVERGGSIDQTAYALLSDLVTIAEAGTW
jgi:homoserine dehydrogenase